MSKIILISGKMGSGKTTLQKELAHQIFIRNKGTNHKVFLINFADVLYEMHDAVLAVLHKYKEPRDIVKDGPLLQLLGTDWGRKTLGENIWVDIMRARVGRIQAENLDTENYFIVGDCRFENEFDVFPEALRVRLYCPEVTRKERCSMWRENTAHPSETGLDQYYVQDKFDVVLNTQVRPPEMCASVVLDALETDWTKRRKK